MDYRSYYMHYECGTLIYKHKVLAEMKKDYLETLKQCQQITPEIQAQTSIFKEIAQAILNLFSPLM